jgi:dTDP-4-amino-4,6-dideoxygalactose transaminase
MLLPADPKAGYLAQKEAIDRVIMSTLESGWYIMGPQVAAFEKGFAAYLGCSECVGVANGTDALNLSLRACGVSIGDEVLTVSHTAVATVSAIDWIGARPVLVDIDPVTFTLDVEKVEETLKNRPGQIKAMVAVHLYGHPASVDALSELADRHGVAMIEDCAQAHGARVGDKKVGTYGCCSAFSFYPTKNLGALGDGGAIVTNRRDVLDKLRLLQQYGWRERYVSVDAGYNSRLDELQAAILMCKLPFLDQANERRRCIAKRYTDGLSGLPLLTPTEAEGFHHVYHQYVIRFHDRDGLKAHLEKNGIRAAILYPMPVHLQSGYANRISVGCGGLGVTEAVARDLLCLPIYPELSDANVEQVISGIRSYFSE